jgi:hypothetical protein
MMNVLPPTLFISKSQQKLPKSSLFNVILPKMPSLIVLLFKMIVEFQCKFKVILGIVINFLHKIKTKKQLLNKCANKYICL